MNGVITGISPENCKVLYCEVFSKFSKGGSDWEEKKEIDVKEYIEWKESHICSKNHDQSSGAMETVGAKLFSERSRWTIRKLVTRLRSETTESGI